MTNFEDWLLSELNRAYIEARKGKRATTDEHVFELGAMENLVNLRDSILSHAYKPGRGIAFVVKKPVIREIFAAPFRDRVVHHFLFNMVYNWWDCRLIDDCYSCRIGKGTWYGVRRASKHMRRASENYTHPAYIIKLDVQGYFMNLPRQELYNRVVWGLDRQFPYGGRLYELLRYLWAEIIFDDPTVGVRKKGTLSDWSILPKSKSLFNQPPGRGIVIGNLSSQLLSNIYLDRLDRFIMFDLGYKNYGRYVDDFYFMIPEELYTKAKLDVFKIESFLRDLGLTLHPQKRYFQNINKGMTFLGTNILPGRILPGKRVVGNFRTATRQVSAGIPGKDLDTIISYLGFMKNLDGKKTTRMVFDEVGWRYYL